MADTNEIEYEFEDLRRNEDELPPHVLAHFGEAPSEYADAAHAAAAKKGDEEVEDPNSEGKDDDEEQEMIPRSEVEKRMARVRRDANRKLDQARQEASETIDKLNKRIDKIEGRDELEEIENEYNTKLKELESEIDEAVEAGDSKKVSQLTAKISELTAERVTKQEQAKAKRASDEHDDPADLNDPNNRQQTIIPRAKDWLAEQQDWWDDPEHAHVKAYVNRLDRVLQQRGYDPNEDDFYEQLEAQVDKKFPGIIVKTMDEEGGGEPDDDDEFADIPDKRTQKRRRQRQAARRSPTGDRTGSQGGQGGGEGGGRRGGRGKGDTLTRAQIANMRMFGMDPSNKDHVESYLREVKADGRK